MLGEQDRKYEVRSEKSNLTADAGADHTGGGGILAPETLIIRGGRSCGGWGRHHADKSMQSSTDERRVNGVHRPRRGRGWAEGSSTDQSDKHVRLPSGLPDVPSLGKNQKQRSGEQCGGGKERHNRKN